uniref:8.9 kDa family member n=1 Tax=Rhipicephalus appendiculatus TaxID=34631 RepID=A0A131YFM2_RHIAP
MKHLVALLFFSLLLMVIAKPAAQSDTSPGGKKNARGVGSWAPPENSENRQLTSNEADFEHQREEDEEEEDDEEEEEEEEEKESSEEENGALKIIGGNGVHAVQLKGDCVEGNDRIPNGKSKTLRVDMPPPFGPCVQAICLNGQLSKQMCPSPPEGGSGCTTVTYNDTEFPACCPGTQCEQGYAAVAT